MKRLALLCATFLVAGCGSPPFRAAAIVPSAVDDHAFSQSLADSLVREQQSLGADEFQFAIRTHVVEGAPAEEELRAFAKQGNALVIAHGVQYRDAVRTVAAELPEVSFAFSTSTEDFTAEGLANVFTFDARAEEGGYVNGVMAARLSHSGILGVVGPIEAGDAKRYIDGFVAGARATRSDVVVRVSYTGSFDDTALAAEVAQQHLDAGADVLTGVGQLVVGAIALARSQGALWFGAQSDQAPLAPEVVVASEVYHWEVPLESMRRLMRSGVRGGRSFTIGLSDGGERIAFNPAYPLPADVKALAQQTLDDIAAGKLRVQVAPAQ